MGQSFPKGKAQKDLSLFVRICCFGALIRGLQNLESSRKGKTVLFFSRVRKEPKVHQRFANLWTPGTIQSSAGRDFAEISSGSCRNRFCLQNGGVKALNRCERVTVVQTQDRCFSKKSYYTASSQQQAVFKKGCCTLVWVRCEIEIFVC